MVPIHTPRQGGPSDQDRRIHSMTINTLRHELRVALATRQPFTVQRKAQSQKPSRYSGIRIQFAIADRHCIKAKVIALRLLTQRWTKQIESQSSKLQSTAVASQPRIPDSVSSVQTRETTSHFLSNSPTEKITIRKTFRTKEDSQTRRIGTPQPWIGDRVRLDRAGTGGKTGWIGYVTAYDHHTDQRKVHWRTAPGAPLEQLALTGGHCSSWEPTRNLTVIP